MCGGYKKGENPSERGKNKIQWITNFTPAGLRGRVILGKGENMSELISRQQAIDALRKMQTYKLFSGDDMLLIDQAGAQTELMLLPPAQPEPKMGKWKRHYCEDGNPDGWQCDKCKEWYYFGQTLPNFCPNCGADMREVTT